MILYQAIYQFPNEGGWHFCGVYSTREKAEAALSLKRHELSDTPNNGYDSICDKYTIWTVHPVTLDKYISTQP